MGVQKLVDAAMHMTTKNGVGSTLSCVATANAIGKLKAAAALFVISSVKIFVMMKRTARTPYGPRLSVIAMTLVASMGANPEFSIALLMANAHAMVIRMSQEMY